MEAEEGIEIASPCRTIPELGTDELRKSKIRIIKKSPKVYIESLSLVIGILIAFKSGREGRCMGLLRREKELSFFFFFLLRWTFEFEYKIVRSEEALFRGFSLPFLLPRRPSSLREATKSG